MIYINKEETSLQELFQCGIIDEHTLSLITSQMIMQKEKQYLSQHTQKMWQSKNGRYMTYLYNDSGKRKLISKGSQEDLESCIIEHYKKKEEQPTTEEIFQRWIDGKLDYGEIERQTYDKYKNIFTRCMDEVKNVRISEFTETKLEDLIKRVIHDKELNYKAWSDWRIIINGMFRYAHKHKFTNMVIREFMDDLQLSPRIFKETDKTDEDNVFTDKEVDAVLNHIYTGRITKTDLGIILAFQTGLRSGEIVVLLKQDIDLDKKILYVTKTETHHKENGKIIYEIKPKTKGKKGKRIIYLSEGAIKTLRILISMAKDDNLFETHAEAFTNRLYRICEKLGLKKRSLHKCRKTYTTRLVNAGIPDILIQKMLGHTDRTVTYRHYVFDNREQEEERELIAEASNF